MSNAKSTALQNAHELIERGELEAAQELLVPLLETDADDAGVWWVYAHAVRDIGIGQAALRRVLELDPLYPGARELAQDMNRLEAPLLANPLTADESLAAQNTDIDIDDWEDLQPAVGEPQPNQQSARIGTTVLVTALLLLIVGGVLIATGTFDINQLLAGILSTPQPATLVEASAQPSDTFSIGTAVPQEEISPIATMQEQAAREVEIAGTLVTDQTPAPSPTFAPSPTYVPLPKAESDFVQQVAQQIDAFSLDTQQTFLIHSNVGNTLVLQTCALPGGDFNAKVASIIQAVVTLADEIPAELDALAAGLLNCDDPGASLHLIGTEARLIRDFANGAIDDRAFQREWKQLAKAPREAAASAVSEAPLPTATATAAATEAMPEAAVEIAATATDEPAQPLEPAPTLAPSPTFVPLPRAESDFVQQVTQQIRGFSLDPKQAFLRDSDAGNTLVLQTCALPGADFNAKIASIMQAVVTLADEIPAELDAVAAGLLNCDAPGARLRLIGLQVQFFRDFASGAIDDRAFQREWKQLG